LEWVALQREGVHKEREETEWWPRLDLHLRRVEDSSGEASVGSIGRK